MKKNLFVFIVFSIAYFTVGIMQAQTLKTYSGEKKCYGSISPYCKETYSYYVGEDGSYVKSGTYTLSGSSRSLPKSVTSSYVVTATYKDGILNGPLTAKLIVKGRGEWNYTFHEYDQYNIEETLTANFKGGVPDGKWTYTELGREKNDKSIYKTTFTCKDGKFVGDFNCNFSNAFLPKHMQGKFDNEGHLLSLTIHGDAVGSGYYGEENATKEYHIGSNGDLLTFFHRDKNNNSIQSYRINENLFKEYEEQNKSPKSFMEEKGYYILKETSSMEIIYASNPFGTATIVEYILNQLELLRNLTGFENSNGLFYKYSVDKCEFSKVAVKPLSELQFLNVMQVDTASVDVDSLMFFKKTLQEQNIFDLHNILFMFEQNTLYYFTELQTEQYKNEINRKWKEKLEEYHMALVTDLANKEIKNGYFLCGSPVGTNRPITIVSYKIDSLWKVSNDKYCCKCLIDYKTDVDKTGYEWESAQTGLVYKIAYSEHWYLGKTAYAEQQFDSTQHWNHIDNVWHYIATQDAEIRQLSKEYKNLNRSYQKVYTRECEQFKKGNSISDISSQAVSFRLMQYSFLMFIKHITNINTNSEHILALAKENTDIVKTYQGISKTWNLSMPVKMDNTPIEKVTWALYENDKNLVAIEQFQCNCMNFVEKRKVISEKNTEIASNSGKEFADVAKNYFAYSKSYNVALSSDTNDNNTRLNNLILIQDSCLSFIELRKLIAQNNDKIAGYSKAASNIIKSYSTQMKGTDLSWNQNLGRNQALREIINAQNELLNVLSKPNISEMNKTVKKSKAKTWENVKKIIFQ